MNFAVDIVVKTSVILISAVLLAALLSRASAATRHAIWVLAIASALLLPLAATLVPQLDLPLPLHPSTSVTFWLSDEGSAGGAGAIARSLKLRVIAEVIRLERNPAHPQAALQVVGETDEWRGLIWEEAAIKMKEADEDYDDDDF